MSERIAIDSLEELVSYVEMYLVTDEVREMILNMEEYRSPDFHFGFAGVIRNRFVLDDPELVPQLIDDYMRYIDPPDDNFVNLSEEQQQFEIGLSKMIYLNPDGVSAAVCKMIWYRIHNKRQQD
ncbi:hypothetical protein D3C77_378370 [compost metagenome]